MYIPWYGYQIAIYNDCFHNSRQIHRTKEWISITTLGVCKELICGEVMVRAELANICMYVQLWSNCSNSDRFPDRV